MSRPPVSEVDQRQSGRGYDTHQQATEIRMRAERKAAAPTTSSNDELEHGRLVGSPSISDDQTPIRVHPEAYYDDHGRLIKQCFCGKEGVFGYGVSLRQGKLGKHYCSEHWPDRPIPATTETTKPPPKPPDLQALFARHGGYDKIAPEAWAEWDRSNAEWQERRRLERAALAATPDEQIIQRGHSNEDGAQLLIDDREQSNIKPNNSRED